MPYRAIITTIVTVALALLAVGMWVRAVEPMIADAKSGTAIGPGTAILAPTDAANPSQTRPITPEKEQRVLIKGTLLLSFLLICMLMIVGLFSTFREWVRMGTLRKKNRTRYVDAWKLAGERMEVTPPDGIDGPDQNSDK